MSRCSNLHLHPQDYIYRKNLDTYTICLTMNQPLVSNPKPLQDPTCHSPSTKFRPRFQNDRFAQTFTSLLAYSIAPVNLSPVPDCGWLCVVARLGLGLLVFIFAPSTPCLSCSSLIISRVYKLPVPTIWWLGLGPESLCSILVGFSCWIQWIFTSLDSSACRSLC